MTFSEFESMPGNKQAEYAMDKGLLVIERIVGKFHVLLYKLDNFYIEIGSDTVVSDPTFTIRQLHKDSSALDKFLHSHNEVESL